MKLVLDLPSGFYRVNNIVYITYTTCSTMSLKGAKKSKMETDFCSSPENIFTQVVTLRYTSILGDMFVFLSKRLNLAFEGSQGKF